MRTYFLVLAFTLYNLIGLAQKPAIDSEAITNWVSVEDAQISNSGAFALYTIENQPFGKSTLVITDTKNRWKIDVPGFQGYPIFSSDSKRVFFMKGSDSLGIIETGTSKIQYILGVQSFSKSKIGHPDCVIYQLNNPQKSLIIKNLTTGEERSIDFVEQYQLTNDGNTLLFLNQDKKNSPTQALNWFDIPSGDWKIIWQGDRAGNFVFDRTGKQIAFAVENGSPNGPVKTFWYYGVGTDKAIMLASNQSIENDTTLQLQGITFFSGDKRSLFVTLQQKDFRKTLASPVNVWSYSDIMLQPVQQKNISSKTYKAVINLPDSRLFRLEQENETLNYSLSNNWGLIICREGHPSELVWNVEAYLYTYLISLKHGKRKKIPELDNKVGTFSPNGKYVIYYDPKVKNYFSYEIDSGFIRNITKGLFVDWRGYSIDEARFNESYRGIAGWLKNDEGVLLYDHNDIWQIDMAGGKPPINLTNGYGKKHNIVFFLGLSKTLFSANEELIINAFNRTNKENGYYQKTVGKAGDPELLSIGPYVYDIPQTPWGDDIKFTPLKALDTNVYLVRRNKADEAPNFFITSDFKTFTPLSDVQPQRKYNWLTSELITWKGLNGKPLKGILYRPENFDPAKKYPIIFHYYDKKSDGLHEFLQPKILNGGMDINIPWYVSRGYLVFLVDIQYKIGETGESVVNSVVSAAQYMSTKPWVNSKKMGIQGGSFGGFETNYLVTHTNLFAAACASAAISDMVSKSGFVTNGISEQGYVQYGQYRMGASLWERPDIYVKNSPVIASAKVTTPLLMMQATNDPTCTIENALEFFTALRRLGKKVWMLEYADGNHGIWEKSATDFNIRMQQFFDHYLKDEPAPKWMIQGVPAKDKGFDDGLELVKEKDPKTGKWVTPKESPLLTEEERKKVEALKKRKPITITLE